MKHALHRPLTPVTMALALALTLSACSQDEPAAFEDTATQAAADDDSAGAEEPADADTTEESDTAADAGSDGGDDAAETDEMTEQSAAAAGIDLAELGEPIATTTIPAVVSDDPDATLDVSLYSLVRDGQTVIGTYSFHVSSDSEAQEPEWIYDYLGSTSWTPHLIDTENLARHDVLLQDGVRAMTAYQGAKFRPGQTFFAYAAFAAPPAEVTTMTASLVDGGAPVREVPIQ